MDLLARHYQKTKLKKEEEPHGERYKLDVITKTIVPNYMCTPLLSILFRMHGH